MASDQRWTGGVANREWTRGHTAGRVINHDRIKADVTAYLADCHANRALLSPAYHPTEAGALKAIYHHGDAEADAVRAAYQQAVHANA
jgi:hypothetical protein